MDQQKLKSFFEQDSQSIPGWFFPLDQLIFTELYALQSAMHTEGDLCEIGVFRGKSLVLMSILRSAEERLIGFDLFADDDEEETKKNLELYGETANSELIKGLTSDLSESRLDAVFRKPLRFLHIDAGHEYHEVLEQLERFSPYVGDAGIIAMDDYQDREFPGIEAATLDFASIDRPRRFVPFLAGGNKMFLCSAWLSAKLQTHLLSRQNFLDSCRLTRVRDFNILIAKSKLPVTTSRISEQIKRTEFPKRSENHLSAELQSATYAQIEFGSGR